MGTQQDRQVRHVVKKRYWTEADARIVVDAWKQSGETQRAFSERYDLSVWRLIRWSTRLHRRVDGRMRFHPVRLTVTPEAVKDAPLIELILNQGRRVRVPKGFDAEELKRLVISLEGIPSC